MGDSGDYSDEPTRVAQIVKRFFQGQSGSHLATIGTTEATLTVGADSRDDCAVIDFTGELSLVFGSDYVRGPKFALYERGLIDNYDIGYFLVAANVSDIAAMGAKPIALTTVVRYPKSLTDEGFAAIVAGINDAAHAFGALNVGGDIGGAERIILSASAIGGCVRGTALRRSGAKPGDVLCVTGQVGCAGAAVAYFGDSSLPRHAIPESLHYELLQAWKRPQARTKEGWILGSGRLASSCQDTSDGLKATIEQLGTASGVGFVVNRDKVPVAESTDAVAHLIGTDPLTLALSASVDFQLAFTVHPKNLLRCREAFEEAGCKMFEIGLATDDPRFRMVDEDQDTDLPGVAWRHQSGDISKLARGTTI